MKRKILQGLRNVEAANTRTPDPNGRYPVCVPDLGTTSCVRCSSDVRTMLGKPCPSVPPDKRGS